VTLDETVTAGAAYLRDFLAKPPRDEKRKLMTEARVRRQVDARMLDVQLPWHTEHYCGIKTCRNERKPNFLKDWRSASR
jgi:hypothetical protein